MKALGERLSSLVASEEPDLPIYWVRNDLLTQKERGGGRERARRKREREMEEGGREGIPAPSHINLRTYLANGEVTLDLPW